MTELGTHPYRKNATRQVVVGALLVILGLGMSALGYLSVGLPLLVLAPLYLFLGLAMRRHTDAVLLNNAAFDLVSRGRIAEAEALLARAESASGAVRRAVAIQRAMIALRRGDASTAETHASSALATKPSFLTRDAEIGVRCTATAIRALARASMGKEQEALADIADVRASKDATPDALARAAVAEATVLARRDDKDALARCLRDTARLLEWAPPRERALVRALRRMLELRAGSVYREAARPPEESREDPLLRDWVARIVPAAAAYVPQAERRTESAAFDTTVPEDFPVHAGSEAVTRRSKRPSGMRVLLVWLLLVLMFVAIWSFLTPDRHGTSPPPGFEEPATVTPQISAFLALLCTTLVVVVYGAVAKAFVRARAEQAALRDAARALAEGDEARCTRDLEELVRRAKDATAAAALRELAVLAERRADMKKALALCDAGLERISKNAIVRAANSDILVPELVAERAFVLAALGRDQQATAELALLAREHPSFAYLTRSVFRVRLVQALRKRDHEAALAIARERTPELPLSRRDEMLADIVLALSGGKVVDGEIERIVSELSEDAELAAWIDFIAPGARERLAAKTRMPQRVRALEDMDAASFEDPAGQEIRERIK